MSLKCGLVEAKTRLCRTFALTKNVGINLQQRIIARSFTHQKAFRNVKLRNEIPVYSSKTCRNFPFIDTGQRSLHVVNPKGEKIGKEVMATSEVQQEEQEMPIIEPAIPHEEIVLHLNNCKTVGEQMTRLYSILRLSDEDVRKRISICNGIRDMLQPFFEDFKLQLYGSSINSFGFKGCDIDMTFKANVEEEEVMSMAFDDSEIPLWEDVLSGKVSRKHISRLSRKDQLLFIHFVFLDYYKDSNIAPLYIRAYVPVVRFVNDKYNIKCDLTCGNSTALANTKLLYFYGKMDERVTQLMIAIRYWAKYVGLIGPGLTFNTYTISLMLIYYLQTRTPPVLPPAEYIFSVANSVMSYDMYDKNILKDIEKIPPSKNTESVEDLFRGFFFYYLYFDFTKVICPLKSIAVPREEFCAEETNKRFRMNTICVQDPIKLSHNVANMVDYRNCRKFGKEMLVACKSLQDKTFWTPQQSDWGLLKILIQEDDFNSNDEAFLNFEVPLQFCNSESKEQVLQRASDLVINILEKALLFDCGMIQKTEETDFSDGMLLFSSKCKGLYNTWLGRNCAEPDENLKDILEQEHSVSLKLCHRKKEEKQKEFDFICKGYVVDKNNQLSLHVKLTPYGKLEFSPALGIFLKEYIPRTVRSLW